MRILPSSSPQATSRPNMVGVYLMMMIIIIIQSMMRVTAFPVRTILRSPPPSRQSSLARPTTSTDRRIVRQMSETSASSTTTRISRQSQNSTMGTSALGSVFGDLPISSLSSSSSLQQQQQELVLQEGIMRQQQMILPNLNTLLTPSGEVMNKANEQSSSSSTEYQRGIMTIGFITLLFASNSPVLHAAFTSSSSSSLSSLGLEGTIPSFSPPPVLLLNAAVSVVALVGLWLGGESLESKTTTVTTTTKTTISTTTTPVELLTSSSSSSSSLSVSLTEYRQQTQEDPNWTALQAGVELGLWKFLATTANLYGLAYTTAGHGALLIQLTTLIVPVVQGIQGVPIPTRIQTSIVLALAGVICFTQDTSGTPSALGDALCVLAAIFYATYDLRLFTWGKQVNARTLITTKIATQALFSLGLLAILGRSDTMEFLSHATMDTWKSLLPVILWSGIAVNAIAPYLQVGGQQVVGPTRCQTIYASQPLWAAIMSYIWLGETIGIQGMIGGSAFLVALFLAATTEATLEESQEKEL